MNPEHLNENQYSASTPRREVSGIFNGVFGNPPAGNSRARDCGFAVRLDSELTIITKCTCMIQSNPEDPCLALHTKNTSFNDDKLRARSHIHSS